MGAWFGGVLIFFSDIGTPLIVGPVFEKVFDKAKISREKLAWIIDSTSSPVAVLIPFIGWGVYIMGLIKNEFDLLNITTSEFSTLVQVIPFQFYAILAVIDGATYGNNKIGFRSYGESGKTNTTDGCSLLANVNTSSKSGGR